MITDTAMVGVQWVYTCQHALGCANLVSVAPYCPMHGGFSQLYDAMESSKVYDASVLLASMRGEFRQAKASA